MNAPLGIQVFKSISVKPEFVLIPVDGGDVAFCVFILYKGFYIIH